MVSTFYMFCFLLATANPIYLAQKKYKDTDRYLWTILLLVPVVILGYWIKSRIHTAEAALVAYSFIYLDSTVLPVVLLFSFLKSIGKEASPLVKLTIYVITILHAFSIWMNIDTDLYYSNVTIEETSLGTITWMESGPLKITHYIFLSVVGVALISVLIVGFLKKGTHSRKNVVLYMCVVVMMFVAYAVEVLIHSSFTILPGIYVIGSIIITINYDQIQSHTISNLIAEKQDQASRRGFCAFDTKRCLLGYNSHFSTLMPEIERIIVDENVPEDCVELYPWINRAFDEFEKNGTYTERIYSKGRTLQIAVSEFSLSERKKRSGYLVEIEDISDEQKKIDTIEKYNTRLSEDVSKKTEHILDIQNSVVLGLANMVENRDDNTGGHVKRTSDVVRLLIEEIQRQGAYAIDEQTAKDIVRAAPMHDLGKISIDSSLLCKPGKLTKEEYEIMKTHAPKSGEIVKIILEGVEEQHFVDISYNLARHHHERWDGKGYPDGLMGEAIPLEARIMAVADVYDALVSKRCYKAPMSFEQASKIMNDSMGSQFDPAMRPVFVASREKLETYYRENASA